jgi:hypothetical protein
MPIDVVEIHHHGIRIDGDAAGLAATSTFIRLLGLTPDWGRPKFPRHSQVLDECRGNPWPLPRADKEPGAAELIHRE